MMRRLYELLALTALIGTMAARGADAAEAEQFASTEDAVAAVVAALQAHDRDGLLAVFGSAAEDVIFTGEEAQDRAIWTAFMVAYNEMHRLAEQSDGTAVLYIGEDQWPFPVPLIQTEAGWQFDAEAARDEVWHRRIGANELDVIAMLEAYVIIQARYRRIDHDGDGVMEFAGDILSSPDARDGLYWDSEPGVPESPIGDFVARANAVGYSIGGEDAEPEPFLGYYYRVLHSQGEQAPGGAYDYRVNGNMVAGHAMLAFPAAYGETGIMSFMVAENGEVLEADLGEETTERALAMEAYDPGEGWSPVE